MLIEVDMSFVDYVNSFDKLQDKDRLDLLGKLDFYGKYIRILRNFYWKQTTMRTEKKFS